MMRYVLLLLVTWGSVKVSSFVLKPASRHATLTRPFSKAATDEKGRINMDTNPAEATYLDEILLSIAHRFKLCLETHDLDEEPNEGVPTLESNDNDYGIEVLHTTIPLDEVGGLGLTLQEMAGNPDGRGLVLVSKVSGNAALADPPIQIGDVITGVSAGSFRASTKGLNYDETFGIIQDAKDAAPWPAPGDEWEPSLRLEIDRLVKRAKILVEVEEHDGKMRSIEALAGENLRRMLLRNGVQLYDSHTKRFDMPYASGDCAGDGLCGTCLVQVNEGAELLSEKHQDESLITQGRPTSWRASCRTVVGASNEPGTLRIKVRPQSEPHETNLSE